MSKNAVNTHLCGGLYSDTRCEYLMYITEKGVLYSKKQLKQFYIYCTSEGKCRSMGCSASWTGNSPKWCPKRRSE